MDVKVKPLGPWKTTYRDGTVEIWQATTGFGSVYQARIFDDKFWMDTPDGTHERHISIDTAKAAAQADYERRILSALKPPTSSV